MLNAEECTNFQDPRLDLPTLRSGVGGLWGHVFMCSLFNDVWCNDVWKIRLPSMSVRITDGNWKNHLICLAPRQAPGRIT